MNYQHLFYFRTVAVLGGITPAAQQLRLTPPTLSGQVRTLEEAFGVSLFERTARGMVLTDAGRIALRYANQIFSLGAELEKAVQTQRGQRVRVGVETSIVAATARPLLARLAGSATRVVCTFGSHHELITALKALELDLVLTTAPSPEALAADVVSELVAETEVAFFASVEMAAALRTDFPRSLDGASFIAMPRSALRESLERWLASVGARLAMNIEIGDASVAAALAADGVGIIAAPLSASVELRKRYDLASIGVAEGVVAQIHAVGSQNAIDELAHAVKSECA
ncbi:MAG: LysR family transcriptional regulator [Labilithrix sp.]|nr:LysR family transcriptional regulator [Labilithrix sp.]